MENKIPYHDFCREVTSIGVQLTAKKAMHILQDKMNDIQNVNDWAKKTGCSRSWLIKCMRYHKGKTPNAVLRDERFKKIQLVILQNPEATASAVADRIAPNWNERRLYNFLRKLYNTNFTILRYGVLNNRL